jgi:hypothetical protein
MTASRDPDRLIRQFVLEGEEQLQDQVYDAIRAEIDHKRQRVLIGPWRMPVMNKVLAIGLGAAAVVVVAILGAQFLGSGTNVGGPGPEPTPTEVPTPTPTREDSPAGLPLEPIELEWDGMPDEAPRITLTIPAPGWRSPGDGILEKGNEVENLPEAAIITFSEAPGTAFHVFGDPCRLEATRPDAPATTVDEITAALAAQASRNASEPADITVGGYTGKVITLHVPEDADVNACEGGEFASFGIADDDLARYHQGPGQIDELWIIDVDGAIVIIDAMYRSDTPDELIEEMRTMAASATFALP